MDPAEFVGHLVIWILILSIIAVTAYVVLKRLIYLQRFCVSCRGVTKHIVDYGSGHVMSYLMAFMTLGWRTMIQSYYPVKCLICGQPYKAEAVEEYRKQAGLVPVGPPEPKARDWKGMGGDRDWKELKLHQQIYIIVMISLGILVILFYLFYGGKKTRPNRLFDVFQTISRSLLQILRASCKAMIP